jgi:glycosyltransferase involved in cell wall biosynthesis
MRRPAFTVLVPAYNEAESLGTVLDQIATALIGLADRYAPELIVVDDGSTDGTHLVARAFESSSAIPARLLVHDTNRGLVEAIRTGTEAARTPWIVTLDADLSYAPGIIQPLIDRLLETGAAAVLASPYVSGGSVANVPFGRWAASRAANLLLSRCTGGEIATFTGMVRAYDATFLRRKLTQRPHGEFNAWIVSEALREGRRICEVPARLAWPEHRRTMPGRLPFRKLVARTAQVALVCGDLLAVQRRPGKASAAIEV